MTLAATEAAKERITENVSEVEVFGSLARTIRARTSRLAYAPDLQQAQEKDSQWTRHVGMFEAVMEKRRVAGMRKVADWRRDGGQGAAPAAAAAGQVRRAGVQGGRREACSRLRRPRGWVTGRRPPTCRRRRTPWGTRALQHMLPGTSSPRAPRVRRSTLLRLTDQLVMCVWQMSWLCSADCQSAACGSGACGGVWYVWFMCDAGCLA